MTVPANAVDVKYSISAESTESGGEYLEFTVADAANSPGAREAADIAAYAAMDHLAALHPTWSHTISRYWQVTTSDQDRLQYPPA